MTSLIEQASLRLEQLRKAGVAVPEVNKSPKPMGLSVQPPVELPLPVPAAISRKVEIDLDALAAAGIVSPNAPRSQIADQFRVIKRPLIANALGKGASPVANVVFITTRPR